MKKTHGLVALIVAGFLIIPVQVLPGTRAYAQSGSEKSEERQRQELEQKYQEQWDYLERLNQRQQDTGQRLQEAEKRRRDAEKRQGEAERRLQELEQQGQGGKTK